MSSPGNLQRADVLWESAISHGNPEATRKDCGLAPHSIQDHQYAQLDERMAKCLLAENHPVR